MILRMLNYVVLGILALWLGMVVGDRSLPTDQLEPARLLTPVVKPGGELLTECVVYRERLCHTVITRMMFDSRDVRFDIEEAVYSNGAGPLGRDTFTGRQIVPHGMAPGPARFVALPCYRCNWAQWVWPLCEPAREQRFTVAP